MKEIKIEYDKSAGKEEYKNGGFEWWWECYGKKPIYNAEGKKVYMGICGFSPIYFNYKYCPECGSKIKWIDECGKEIK